jgi:hypothetical protein
MGLAKASATRDFGSRMITPVARLASAGFPSPQDTPGHVKALFGILIFALLQQQSSLAQVGENPPATTIQTNHATVRGTGRSVIGKLVFPPTVARNGTQRIRLDFDGGGMAEVAPDGTFRGDHVPAGNWGFLVFVEGQDPPLLCTGDRTIAIPEMPSDRNDEPVDLGTVEAVPVTFHTPQIGETLPLFEVKTTDGKTFKLADHRGQYVLLDFEPLGWFHQTDFVEEALLLDGTNNRLAALTFIVQPMGAYQIGAPKKELPWPQTQVRDLPWSAQYPLRAGLGLPIEGPYSATIGAGAGNAKSSLPLEAYDHWPHRAGVLLVGPDGKVVARDLDGDAIKITVALALRRK